MISCLRGHRATNLGQIFLGVGTPSWKEPVQPRQFAIRDAILRRAWHYYVTRY